MAKYSFDFKLKVVEEYLSGNYGYESLAQKYGIPNHSQIKKRVLKYKVKGISGLKRSRKNNSYSVEFKLKAIAMYEAGESSYEEIALQLGIPQGATIAIWRSKYHKQGISGLSKERGRPKLKDSKKKIQPSEQKKEKQPFSKEADFKMLQEAQNRIKDLEHENLMLTIRNEYLEQLRSLKLRQAQKTKQESSSSSEIDTD